MQKRILFIDVVHPVLEERLIDLGYVCEQDLTSSKGIIELKIENYFGIVIRSRFPIDKEFLDKATQLKFIARSGAGLENIDINYAKNKGVKVFNSPEGNMDAVGEHAIGMLLQLFNQLKKGDAEVRNAIWDREGNRGLEIAGKTIGIIGYGNMGSAFAKKLSGFGCTVIAYDKYKKGFSNDFVKEVTIEEFHEKVEVVSLHVPQADDTFYLVDDDFISRFKNNIYLINTARGKNVKIADLVINIKSGKVLGACLDVLEYETKSFETIKKNGFPEDFQYLKGSNRIVLSPHVAGWTSESYIKLSSFLADKIERMN